MKPIRFHAKARAELDGTAAFYYSILPELGRDFISATESVLLQIAAHPSAGSPHKNSGFRFRLVRRFPYVVYYLESNDVIWIAAVAHGRRRPDYWRRRRMG